MKQLKFDRAGSRRASPDRADPRGLSSTCDSSDRNSDALDSSDRLNDRHRWFDLVDLYFISKSGIRPELPSIHSGPYRLLPDIATICSRNLSIGTYPAKVF